MAPVSCDPVVEREPLHAPDDEHEVALVLVHDSVDFPPDATVVGLALSFTVGAALDTLTVADCVAEPPGPVQLSSNSEVLVIAPVDAVPLTEGVPCQPPDAVQLVAFAVFQVSVELPPGTTVVGFALSVIIGATASTAICTDCSTEPLVPLHWRVNVVTDPMG